MFSYPKLVKKLSGHSGCNLYLYQDNANYFVRKDSGKENYNRRLKKQFIKQKHFVLPDVKTPKILNYGIRDGLFYFDMDYIQGATLANIFKNIQLNEIDHLVKILFNSLLIAEGKYQKNADSIFKKKIFDVYSKIENKDDEVLKAFNLLKSYDFNKIPCSFCCGDLTLENVILTPTGEIYIIDLLDSFYNSWMIDVAKLLQDLELGWSYRYEKKNFNLNLRLNTAKNILLTKLAAYPNGAEYIECIYMLLLLNTLRIIPYMRDQTTKQFIQKSLNKIIDIINELREE